MHDEPKDRIDIFLIAREAGVSIATVSRVLNNTQAVAEDKAKRVRAACEKYDYRPSHIARAIRLRRTRNIALVTHNLSVYTKNVELIDSMEERLEEYGYCLNIFNTRLDIKRQENIVGIISERVIDGVIVQGSGFLSEEMYNDVIRELKSRKTPFFFVERFVGIESVPHASVDCVKGGEIAGEYLSGLGHQDIGIITFPLKYRIIADRIDGFVRRLKRAGITPKFKMELDAAGHNTKELKRSIAEKFGSIKKSGVSAIFCPTDILAISVINTLWQKDMRVPEDISVIGFDNHPISKTLPKRLTTIDNDLKKLGEIAVDNIIHKIEKGRFPEGETIIEPSLVEGETVRKL